MPLSLAVVAVASLPLAAVAVASAPVVAVASPLLAVVAVEPPPQIRPPSAVPPLLAAVDPSTRPSLAAQTAQTAQTPCSVVVDPPMQASLAV